MEVTRNKVRNLIKPRRMDHSSFVFCTSESTPFSLHQCHSCAIYTSTTTPNLYLCREERKRGNKKKRERMLLCGAGILDNFKECNYFTKSEELD